VRLRELLADRRRVQLDGGLSTALEELGADLDDPLWTASILRELERRNGRYGMVTMCVGGGMGAAGILERL